MNTKFLFRMNTVCIRVFDIVSMFNVYVAVKFGSLRSIPIA
jgi:hypothetical protein